MDSWSLSIQTLSVQMVPFILAVVFHEYAHGYVAFRFGDPSAKNAGRLTLNPLPHIDPMGTILFPALVMLTGINFLFGWAKPVPINPTRFSKYRSGLFWVSFAGPAMNLFLGVLSAAAYCALCKFMSTDFYLFEPLLLMAQGSIYLNFALAIFNLLPLPPLDGSKIIESFLSYEGTKKMEQFSPYSFYILLALMFTGAFQILVYPINFLGNLSIFIMKIGFGLSS